MSVDFVFLASDYTPVAAFVFVDNEAVSVTGVISVTLDDAVAVFAGTIDNSAVVTAFEFVATDYTPTTAFVFLADAVAAVTGSLAVTLDDAVAVFDCAIINNKGVLSVTLDDAVAVFDGNIINNKGSLNVTLDDAVAVFECAFDINVKRVTAYQASSTEQDALAVSLSTQADQNSRTVTLSQTHVTNQDAISITQDMTAVVGELLPLESSRLITQADAQAISSELLSVINTLFFSLMNASSTQQQAARLSCGTVSIQDVLTFMLSARFVATADMSQQTYALLKTAYGDGDDPYTPTAIFNFTDTDYTPSGVFVFGTQPAIDLCEAVARGVYSVGHHSNITPAELVWREFCALMTKTTTPPFGTSPHIDRPRPPVELPPNHYPITIPNQRTHAMNHTMSVVTVGSNITIPLSEINLSYNADSYCWMFSGTLINKTLLSAVQSSAYEPVKLSITINGYNWIVIVDEIPYNKRFGSGGITLTGQSLSKLLGEPYQRLESYTAGSDMTVQQIMDVQLPVNWVSNWDFVQPWLVPANTFSYTQKTRLQVLSDIAQKIGSVLVPSRNTQAFTMQARYPVAPWNYHAQGVEPDLIIPDSAIEDMGLRMKVRSQINAVYVHGEQSGVLAFCRLNGTAGDVLAPTQSNSLITDVTAARALGGRILAGQYTQPETVSIVTRMGGEFPLAEMGWLVAVNNERVTVSGVSIKAKLGSVMQTLTFGENTDNVYSKFINLLPDQPLLVGELVASSGEVSILTLLDGGVITARGSGTVGAKYYVRNGLIESAAPNLTPVEIVI